MSIELKIKSKHLGVEAKIIRFEELKIKDKSHKSFSDIQLLNTLSNHRKAIVRAENRATFLARALLANKEYYTVEASVKVGNNPINACIVPRILSMANKYSKVRQYTYIDIVNWIKYPYVAF